MFRFLLCKASSSPSVSPVTGSVLHLDSSNPSSYPGFGGTWFDLSPSSNSFTLFNSPTYDSGDAKSFSFSNGTQYAYSSFVRRIGPGYAATIEVVFKRISAFSDNIILSHNRAGSSHGFLFVSGGPAGFGFFVVSTYSPPYGYGVGHTTPIADGNWYHGIISVNIPYGSSATMTGNIAVNGNIQSFSQSGDFSAGAVDYFLELCRHVNYVYGTAYGKFKIGLVRLYDRQLTTAEMTQNYNSCKIRFGI
jgi:hypothetical protein